MDQQVFKINDKGFYGIDMDGEVTELQHAAMTALIKKIQTFDDRKIQISCIFDPVMGGLRISTISLGKVTILGSTGVDDEILIVAVAQHAADSYGTRCFEDHSNHLELLLTTCN